MKRKLAPSLGIWVLVFVPFMAMGQSVFTFQPVCNCSDGCLLGVGEKLKLYAYEGSNNNIYLKLSNESLGAAFIGEIYFYAYNGSHPAVEIIEQPSGVTYTTFNVQPKKLPGWNNGEPFWKAEPTGPEGSGKNGIDANEYLILSLSGMGLEGLVTALEKGQNGGLIFGIHVKGINCPNGDSCSYIQTAGGANPVPIPPAIVLLGSGLLGVSFLVKRRKK